MVPMLTWADVVGAFTAVGRRRPEWSLISGTLEPGFGGRSAGTPARGGGRVVGTLMAAGSALAAGIEAGAELMVASIRSAC